MYIYIYTYLYVMYNYVSIYIYIYRNYTEYVFVLSIDSGNINKKNIDLGIY